MRLVERDKELSALGNMLDACAAGHGGVAWVSGPVAGGKTALLHAFGERAAETGALLLRATAAGAAHDQPLGVLRQLLLGADLPTADADRAARLLNRVAATAPVRGAEGTIPTEVAIDVFPRLCGILLAQARKRPVVLVVDDVHHADAHSLDCVRYLTRRLDVSRMLVVLAESSSFPAADPRFRTELLRRPNCRPLRLDLLPWRGVTEMIAAGQEGWRARPLVSDFHRLSGGSPLLLRALLEDYHAADRARSAELVPGEAFEQAVTACLYRSDPATRDAAWALAVLGPRTAQSQLAEVLGTGPEPVARGLTALTEMGLLSCGWFRHDAGRAAVLRSMEPPHRARLEARAARVLYAHGQPPTALARHLIVAEPVDEPWVLPTLLAAADQALADDAAGLALDCLRVAHDICADEERTLAIRAALLRTGWRVSPSAAAPYLPGLTAAALAGRLDGRDARALVGYLLWFGQVGTAVEVLDVLDALDADDMVMDPEADGGPGAPGGGPRELGFLRLWAAYSYPGFSGLPVPGRAPGGRRDPTPAQTSQQRAAALLHGALERGPGGDVVLRAERLLRDTRLADHTLPAVTAALAALLFADGLDRAASWCDALLKEATERRAPMWQSIFAGAKALVEIRLGRLAAAEESAHTALTLVSPEEWGAAIATPVAALLYAKTAMGRLDEAAGHLSIPVPDAAFHSPGGLLYLWARGHFYLAAGRPYAALDDFRSCGDLMAGWDRDLSALVPWRTDAAQAYLALGDQRRARALAEEQLARGGAGRTWTRGVSLRVLAAVTEPGRRPRLLGEAVEILRERGHRLELARAMDALARAHRDLGDEGRARTLARKAQQLMRESGAEPSAYGPRSADAAAEAGASLPLVGRQWSPGTGWQPVELSDAELRVATLAARGHTNRQIAGKLFITVSTVEQHLTRVYRKLDVQRRTDLAAKLRLDATGPGDAEGGGNGTAQNRLRAV
ncbi:helix-turn-helix transcriptional regulator [Streptomyces varsoviensis]|uniref:helix-turn-helix transcriptional regulator n=1 Tax=Streptomyces varsoviensis TaxID=67373 RepID=UPI0009986634|nr:LuxR family transcriptional regulator [Streptomyces varsoviensis]